MVNETLDAEDSLSEAWPKEFSELKELEKLLRCNICKDFMNTSLITGCSHLFCSYCIRQSIQYRNQCPACFTELYDNQLRPERTLDEVISIFKNIKGKILERLRISYAACPGEDHNPDDVKKKEVTPKSDNVKSSTPPSFPTKNVVLFNSPKKLSTPAKTPTLTRTIPSIFSPVVKKSTSSQVSSNASKSLPLQTCPVCSVNIPERHINLHLDECLARSNGAPPECQPRNEPSRKRLPKLALSLMKEKELKQYCKEYGLNTFGDKKTLVTRIQRYTVVYNSECDSLNPRSKADIIRQIEKEEKPPTSATTLFPQVSRKTDPKIIEEVHTKYLKENKDVFSKLIENMKKREDLIQRSPRPTPNKIVSDDEDADIIEVIKPNESKVVSAAIHRSSSYLQKTHIKSNSTSCSKTKPNIETKELNISSRSSPDLFNLKYDEGTNSPCYAPASPSYHPTSPSHHLTSPLPTTSSTVRTDSKETSSYLQNSPTRREPSPDFFLTEDVDEESNQEHCMSPNLLAGLSSNTNDQSMKVLLQDGHFIMDSPDMELTSYQANNSTVTPTPLTPVKCESPIDSDDDVFLHLVQNKKGKRKPKELLFSPRATRSKRSRKT